MHFDTLCAKKEDFESVFVMHAYLVNDEINLLLDNNFTDLLQSSFAVYDVTADVSEMYDTFPFELWSTLIDCLPTHMSIKSCAGKRSVCEKRSVLEREMHTFLLTRVLSSLSLSLSRCVFRCLSHKHIW